MNLLSHKLILQTDSTFSVGIKMMDTFPVKNACFPNGNI